MVEESGDPREVVIQLLRVLSEIDIDGLREDLRRVDGATARRAVTGASMLAEAVTRATLGPDALGDLVGAEFDAPDDVDAPGESGHRPRGERIEIHDDGAALGLDPTSEA